jgi:hypothetical protein
MLGGGVADARRDCDAVTLLPDAELAERFVAPLDHS